jgi:hypothetical protein
MPHSDTNFYKAITQPQASPNHLTTWWNRKIADFHYHPYKVIFKERVTQQGSEQDILRFLIAGDDSETEFQVDLKMQPTFVWSDLPSTAQLASKEAPCGYLFLSDDWEDDVARKQLLDKSKLMALRDGGGKWPIGGFAEELRLLVKQVDNEQLRSKLLSTVNTLFK